MGTNVHELVLNYKHFEKYFQYFTEIIFTHSSAKCFRVEHLDIPAV